MLFNASKNPQNSRSKPISVLLYNNKMGGVDYIDQKLAPYESLRRTVKWYKKFAFHLIDLTIHNSHVLFQYYKNPTKPKLTYKKVLVQLAEEMIGVNSSTVPRPDRSVLAPKPSETNMSHFPEKVLKPNGKPKNSDCHQCRRKGKRKATPFQCSTCGKRFCIEGPNSCFAKYHQDLKKPRQENQEHSVLQNTAMNQPHSYSDHSSLFQSQSTNQVNPHSEHSNLS